VLSLAAAATGVGAAFELVVAGAEATSTTTLTYASLIAGIGADGIDFAKCVNGDSSACAGAALGLIAVVPGLGAAAGGSRPSLRD